METIRHRAMQAEQIMAQAALISLLAVGLLAIKCQPPAMTLPFIGPVFFGPPTETRVEHEMCHNSHRLQKGDVRFALDYLAGGGKAEENSCGDNPDFILSLPIPR